MILNGCPIFELIIKANKIRGALRLHLQDTKASLEVARTLSTLIVSS